MRRQMPDWRIVPGAHQLFLTVIALVMASSIAKADPIVFTGEARSPAAALTLNALVWEAAKFDVAQPFVITSIEGGLAIVNGTGPLTVSLYADGPVPAALLFTSTQVPKDSATGWVGATSIAWPVAPGSYWAALEVHAPVAEGFDGALFTPSQHPLQHEAVRTLFTNGWRADDSLDTGWRILGDPVANHAPTPEPSTLILCGFAFIGTAYRWLRRGGLAHEV